MANEVLPMKNPVQREVVERAVSALLKWREKNSQSMKLQLLEDDELLYLILTLNSIPIKIQTKPIPLRVPHPLFSPATDGSEVCLIYDDRPKSTLTKESVKKKIQDEQIPISKVIKLSKLKSDYRPFEAKRKLCGSYDFFLADRRVIPLLPKMLGKQFFKSRKIPIAVNLEHHNWKEQVESACGSALLFLRTGTCCVIKVGKISMGANHLVENVVAAIDQASERVPMVWGNVRAIHLKLTESLALPIFQTLPDMKCSIESMKEAEGEVTEEESIKVERVAKKSKKERISGVNRKQLKSDDSPEEKPAEVKKSAKKGTKRGRISDAADEKPDEEKKGVKKGKKKGRISDVVYLDDNKSADCDDVTDEKPAVEEKVAKKSKKRERVSEDAYLEAEKQDEVKKKSKKSKKKESKEDANPIKCDVVEEKMGKSVSIEDEDKSMKRKKDKKKKITA